MWRDERGGHGTRQTLCAARHDAAITAIGASPAPRLRTSPLVRARITRGAVPGVLARSRAVFEPDGHADGASIVARSGSVRRGSYSAPPARGVGRSIGEKNRRHPLVARRPRRRRPRSTPPVVLAGRGVSVEMPRRESRRSRSPSSRRVATPSPRPRDDEFSRSAPWSRSASFRGVGEPLLAPSSG